MYKKAISLIIISLFVASCGDTLSAVKRGITGEKQKAGDEFLVQKKDPLILPPDFESLPLPDEAIADEEEEILSLEKTFNKNNSNENDDESSSAEESILKQINR